MIATDLTPPHETVNKIGPTAQAFELDVTNEEDWRSLSLRSRDLGGVDIVVNNAGYFPNRLIDFGPLIQQNSQIADEIPCALAFTYCADDDANSFRNIQFSQNFA